MLPSLTLDDTQNNVNWRLARKADGDTSVQLQVPSLPHEILLDIMKKLLSAKREPEPAATVIQHFTYLRSVSRAWSIFFAKMPVDLLFSGPTKSVQLEWLAAKTSPPVRSVSFEVAPLVPMPGQEAIMDAVLQHCGNSLESLEGAVLTLNDRDIGQFVRLTQLPKLRMLRLLCDEGLLRRGSLNRLHWHDKFYAQTEHDSEKLAMVWVTLRRWPSMGTGAWLQAEVEHEDALKVMQLYEDNSDWEMYQHDYDGSDDELLDF